MTEPVEARRPSPILTEDNHEFWDAADAGRLVAQRCAGCGRLRHPPRPMCPHCHSLDYEVIDLAGTGTVYSYSILHYPQVPVFDYPVVAVIIELDEGVRMVSNLEGVSPEDVRIDMRVAVRYVPTRDGVAVPVFAPLGLSS
jgi:uncharacterized OB-fold protein